MTRRIQRVTQLCRTPSVPLGPAIGEFSAIRRIHSFCAQRHRCVDRLLAPPRNASRPDSHRASQGVASESTDSQRQVPGELRDASQLPLTVVASLCCGPVCQIGFQIELRSKLQTSDASPVAPLRANTEAISWQPDALTRCFVFVARFVSDQCPKVCEGDASALLSTWPFSESVAKASTILVGNVSGHPDDLVRYQQIAS